MVEVGMWIKGKLIVLSGDYIQTIAEVFSDTVRKNDLAQKKK